MPATSEPRIRTLGLRTQLAIESDRAIVTEHDGFIAVRTPSSPGYHFGNFLIFDRAPDTGDELRWPQHFDDVFGGDPQVVHAAFAWSAESENASVEPFVRRGYTFFESAVLTASEVRDFPAPGGMSVRLFAGSRDWNAQLALGLATREACYDADAYERFKRAQVAYYENVTERLGGVWLGMFDGPLLTGSCGIYPAGRGVARYRDVSVLPAYRNRGIARCLVSAAGRFAIERFGATQLVIVADAHDFPRSIYERCGFTLSQRECGLWISARK